MKVGGKANKGYGRTLTYAIRNIIKDKFGAGNHGTRRAYEARLKRFVDFLKASDVTDLRYIDRGHLVDYAEYISDQCESGELSIHYGTNLVSTANVLLDLLTSGACKGVSPSNYVGRRSYVRTVMPCGLEPSRYKTAVEGLIDQGQVRLALTIGICRLAGARFREASLLCLQSAQRSANRLGEIVISKGSKGGRAIQKPRHIEVPKYFEELLNEVVPLLASRTVIPSDQNYIQWYAKAHRQWRQLCGDFAMNSKFHDLRAAFACERYERLTGEPAPCARGHSGSFELLSTSEWMTDSQARQAIAETLGHGRVDVVNSYCGSSK